MTKEVNKPKVSPDPDLLIGDRAIGNALGIPSRKVNYWIAKSYIKVNRVGRQHVASKSRLRADLIGENA